MIESYSLKDALRKMYDTPLERGRRPHVLLITNRADMHYYKDYILKNYEIISRQIGGRSIRINTLDYSILIVEKVGVLERGYWADLVIVDVEESINLGFITNCVTRLVGVRNKGQ